MKVVETYRIALIAIVAFLLAALFYLRTAELNVSSQESVDLAIHQIVAEAGRLDVVIANQVEAARKFATCS